MDTKNGREGLRSLSEIEAALGAHIPLSGERCAGKVALVSGAGSGGDLLGTGAASAILFAAQGASVILFDIDEARAAHTLSIIMDMGGDGAIYCGDVRSRLDCHSVVGLARERFGGLDILMNNTGVARAGDVMTVAEDDWDLMVDINLKGTMLLSQAAMASLGEKGGAIINVSSLAAIQSFGSVAYAASKGGILSMTRDMAYAAGPLGVRVNCLLPGFLATPMGGGSNMDLREERRLATFLGTEGTAWDLAWAALFLASDEARWISAAILNVDAGSSAGTGLARLRRTK